MRKHMRRFIAIITATVLLFLNIQALAADDDASYVVKETNNGLTRIEFAQTQTISANTTAEYEFSVPKNGTYSFMANRSTKYKAKISAYVIDESSESNSIQIAKDVNYNTAQNYSRLGKYNEGKVTLEADKKYKLRVTPESDYEVNFFDIILTDITISQKTIIPAHFYSSVSTCDDNFLNNSGKRDASAARIYTDFSDYLIFGNPQKGQVSNVWQWQKCPISVLPMVHPTQKTGYVEYTLNFTEDAVYKIQPFLSVYSGQNTATPEPIYFSIDGQTAETVMYNPTSYADADQVLKWETRIKKGTHTLRMERRYDADLNQNQYMFHPFVAVEKAELEAEMFANGAETADVKDGNMSCKIHVNNAISEDIDVFALYAIYDEENRLTAIDSYTGKPSGNVIDLAVDDFKTQSGKTYYAKSFLWDSNMRGRCIDFSNKIDEYVDFTVEVPEEKEPVVLQLTDPQIIDGSQKRKENRLDPVTDEYWAKDKKDARCYNYMRETINAVKPDLILLTGDIVYGEFDDNGSAFDEMIEFMENFNIPWAPVFGNHEIESNIGADAMCKKFENAPHCLFVQRELTGNGNYTVGIKQGGKLTRIFFMMDSNGNFNMSQTSALNGHSKAGNGFSNDQREWIKLNGKRINEVSPNTKISFAYHIPVAKFQEAYRKYGFINSGTKENPIDIDKAANREEGDFGYLGGDIKSVFDTNGIDYANMKAIGCDSMFVGHLHEQSASVMYDGVRFHFGLKVSAYDYTNYRTDDGKIVGSYTNAGVPIVGGSVIKLANDGRISDIYHYYCKN